MRIHFIAIGGSAMHNLALALHQKGDLVTGSDDEIFEPSQSRLRQAGLLPESMGWFPEKITDQLDAVILGMHAKADNPELLQAQQIGVRIYSYPEFLYEHAKNKTRVVIGGSHGKTTITAMILHVLQYHQRSVDYMVGAQLEGFDTMVHLTEHHDFMILEGDEYLSSAIDRRPKFHLYRPNIALLSGIAWDHINVFPTFENYKEQFQIFIDSIVPGGSINYNEEDPYLEQLVADTTNAIRKIGYRTPKYTIDNGITYLETDEGPLPLEIFGQHNLSNLAGAKWICQHLGVDEADFHEAITTFKGASKRLEKLVEKPGFTAFKDFAHAPSKVAATTQAVKQQFPDRKVLACLELHTYSSLTPQFLKEYQGSLDAADVAVVFYSPQAVAIKKLNPITESQIYDAFQRNDLVIYSDPLAFQDYLFSQSFENTVLVLMSSGNYGGLDLETVKNLGNPNS